MKAGSLLEVSLAGPHYSRDMQILELECDPWRDQHFAESAYLNEVHIPIDDADAFSLNADHRWVYDKYLVSHSQQLDCGLHDVEPDRFPVVCQPRMSLERRPSDIRIHLLNDLEAYRRHCTPGTFWMPLLRGDEISSDFAVVNAQTFWCRHALGVRETARAEIAPFDRWIVEERARPKLEKFCADWIARHLAGYTGMVNIDSIGGRITGVHLRFTDSWSDLYGRKWLEALVRLYRSRTWDLPVDTGRTQGYSLALSAAPGRSIANPGDDFLATCRSTVGISSVRLIPVDRSVAPRESRAPAEVLVAVVNAFNLQVGTQIRAALATAMGLPSPVVAEASR